MTESRDHRRSLHAAGPLRGGAAHDVCGDELEHPHAGPALAGRADAARLCRRALDGLKEYQGDPDAIAEFIGDAEILVTHLAPVTGGDAGPPAAAQADRRVPRRPGQHRHGGGARPRHAVVNTPGRNASAVAEFTIGAILAETRLITRGHEALRRGDWRGDLYRADLTGDELSELTVGLIGYGHIGTRVVRLLKPFGCRILVDDPYVQLAADDLPTASRRSISTRCWRSPTSSPCTRASPRKRRDVRRPAVRAMKRGSYFINTARGPMVDYEALYDALDVGHLRGAMLETFWQ